MQDFLDASKDSKDSKAVETTASTSAHTILGPILPDTVPSPPSEEPLPSASPASKKQPKVYKCKKCGVIKTKSNDLKDHIVSKHSGKAFTCEHCGQNLWIFKEQKVSHEKKA